MLKYEEERSIRKSPHYEEVRATVLALDQEDKLRLLEELRDSVVDDPGEIEAAWEKEIRKRLDEIDSGAVELIPIEEVFQRITEKYGW